jgi:hypothetical protein
MRYAQTETAEAAGDEITRIHTPPHRCGRARHGHAHQSRRESLVAPEGDLIFRICAQHLCDQAARVGRGLARRIQIDETAPQICMLDRQRSAETPDGARSDCNRLRLRTGCLRALGNEPESRAAPAPALRETLH